MVLQFGVEAVDVLVELEALQDAGAGEEGEGEKIHGEIGDFVLSLTQHAEEEPHDAGGGGQGVQEKLLAAGGGPHDDRPTAPQGPGNGAIFHQRDLFPLEKFPPVLGGAAGEEKARVVSVHQIERRGLEAHQRLDFFLGFPQHRVPIPQGHDGGRKGAEAQSHIQGSHGGVELFREECHPFLQMADFGSQRFHGRHDSSRSLRRRAVSRSGRGCVSSAPNISRISATWRSDWATRVSRPSGGSPTSRQASVSSRGAT